MLRSIMTSKISRRTERRVFLLVILALLLRILIIYGGQPHYVHTWSTDYISAGINLLKGEVVPCIFEMTDALNICVKTPPWETKDIKSYVVMSLIQLHKLGWMESAVMPNKPYGEYAVFDNDYDFITVVIVRDYEYIGYRLWYIVEHKPDSIREG